MKLAMTRKKKGKKKRKAIETGNLSLKDAREAKIKTENLAASLGEELLGPQASLRVIPCSQTQFFSTREKVIWPYSASFENNLHEKA